MNNPHGKCIIFSAPSGAGKTTIVHALLAKRNDLAFSISACSRQPRVNEKDGVDYYFLSVDDFKQQISNDAFIEWEEVYTDMFYGTLKSEVERQWKAGKTVLFDVDVKGGVNLKKKIGKQALSIFVKPPSIEILEQRLRNRNTETEEKIQLRISKANDELLLAPEFDLVVVNNVLEDAINEVEQVVNQFLKS